MDLSKYSLKDVALTAMKSEVESRVVYEKLADRVKNFMLKDRLKFLADEETKHYRFFEAFYGEEFPGEEIVLPDENPVPLPSVLVYDEAMPISEVISGAMDAELAAHGFNTDMADLFADREETRKMLLYIAKMELGHYKLLEHEKEMADEFETYDVEWPMVHEGP
ncbi:MAG: ferritin family protein [Candidatus Coatesbacteria bacterium]|nr:MAG: ferritin family protein [Candidatus Coatesbacteria bacterium]